jgi:phospholipid/cholesterol/gamma-HCH transport system permease protein
MAEADQGSLDIKRGDGVWVVVATGVWNIGTVPALDEPVRKIVPDPGNKVRIDMSGVDKLDSAGAWVLYRLRERLQEQGFDAEVEGIRPEQAGLFTHIVAGSETPELEKPKFRPFLNMLEHLGRSTFEVGQEARDLLSFFGEICIAILHALAHPRRIKLVPVVSQLEQVGFNALPIVGLLSFLIGVVLAFQGADQLRRFGAEIYTVNLLGVSFLREIGILMTAIIIAGRSGSAFTAQIGTMKVNQEIDAMSALGLSPIQLLVLPRILALAIALPLLGFYADILGLVGGAIMSMFVLDISVTRFVDQLNGAVEMWTFWVGIIKAPFFAVVIAMIGCFNGLRVEGSAESVGIMTTKAVVQAIFLVIVLDAAFSILFSFLRI